MVAVALGLVLGRLAWYLSDPSTHLPDFHYYYLATRLWLAGADPYAMRTTAGMADQWPLMDRLFYPLPALMLTAPFTAIDLRAGQALFVGLASGCLAFVLTRSAWWPLLIFCTPSFLMAAGLGQWSLWLTVGALVPWAGFLLAVKPTLGLACWLYKPSWRHIWSGLAIVVLSLALMPRWPVEWLDNLRFVDRIDHPAPILAPGGFVLALAALRWRDPSARFLLAMACVPQLGLYADQLPLFLVAQSREEAALLVLGAWASFVAPILAGHDVLGNTAPYALLGCYAPALYVVLRRRHERPHP